MRAIPNQVRESLLGAIVAIAPVFFFHAIAVADENPQTNPEAQVSQGSTTEAAGADQNSSGSAPFATKPIEPSLELNRAPAEIPQQ